MSLAVIDLGAPGRSDLSPRSRPRPPTFQGGMRPASPALGRWGVPVLPAQGMAAVGPAPFAPWLTAILRSRVTRSLTRWEPFQLTSLWTLLDMQTMTKFTCNRNVWNGLLLFSISWSFLSLSSSCTGQPIQRSGNPIFQGWYADPEGIIIGDEYWIYPA